jgi:transcriptional regulator with XRE-family HTH domain
MTIGERIRQAREQIPLMSQRKLGSLAFLDLSGASAQSKITRIETGKQPPKLDEIEAIASCLNVDVEWIRTGESGPSTPHCNDSASDKNYLQATRDLAEIFTNGDDETKAAISINLRTFVKKIRSEKRVVELEGKMETLERRLDHLEHVNDPRVPNVASGGAGTTTLPEAT